MNHSGEVQETAAPLDEPSLIVRALQGDEAAWEILVRTHQEHVFRLAYLLLGDASEAEDAAQEALIRAWKAIGSFDVGRPFRPWLLSIAANQARNRRRSLGRSMNALLRLVRLDPTPPLSIEEKSDQRLQAQALWYTVRRLSAADQEIIYLRFFLVCSLEEIAITLGIPAGTVKSRLHRSLARLRQVIERYSPDLVEAVFADSPAAEGWDV